MSIEQGQRSDEVSDQPESDSIYDFLYHDARRIASFLSQFEKDGHLTNTVLTRGIAEASNESFANTGGVGLHTLLTLSASGTENTGRTDSEQAAKTYDPLWLNSLALLDYLEARSLINRKVHGSKLGQFALITGKLIVVDIAMIRAVLVSKRGAQHIAKAVVESQAKDQPVLAQRSKKERAEELSLATDMVQAMVETIPAGVAMQLVGDDFGIWSTLTAAGMTGSVDDHLLKHGGAPSGEWNVLGIIDALPDSEVTVTESAGESIGEIESATQLMATLFTSLRPKLGRPAKFYGMTPLLVFREVLKAQVASA
jgi:hypothetical protein